MITTPTDIKRLLTKDANGLLPCPGCNAQGIDASHHSCDCCGKSFTGEIACTVCQYRVDHLDRAEEAKIVWNTRAYLPAIHNLLAEIGRLREALAKHNENYEGYNVSQLRRKWGSIQLSRILQGRQALAASAPFAELAKELQKEAIKDE